MYNFFWPVHSNSQFLGQNEKHPFRESPVCARETHIPLLSLHDRQDDTDIILSSVQLSELISNPNTLNKLMWPACGSAGP